MPGLNVALPRDENWDMDHFDCYQHYFYDDHDPDEDFFKSTAPSEDIWKKFELVPTPPLSPIRIVEGPSRNGHLYPSLGDRVERDTQDEDQQDPPCKLTTTNDSLGNLSSIIIQDCMWSGFSVGQKRERFSSCSGTGSAAKIPGGPSAASPGRAHCVPADVLPLSALAADCVDPAAVLTLPKTVGCKKQVSSGSESQTDSSDDEDDKDEDEEEIDVVTVEHKKRQHKPRRLVGARKPVTITVRADPHDPNMKRFHISIHQQQHNYAAPSPDAPTPPAEAPRKKVRQEPPTQAAHPQQPRPGHAPLNLHNRKSHVTVAAARSDTPDLAASFPTSPSPSRFQYTPLKPRPHPASPQSSDCEDTDKRKAHNFLERKRRNDLRSRFLSLRDEIPGLAQCPKTPKVAILTQATEYLQQLRANERKKAAEKKQLRAQQLQLLHKLAHLRKC